MSFMAVAVGAVAVGAGVSAYGAKQNADAQAAAAEDAAQARELLYQRQKKNLDALIEDKKDKLYDIGNIFERFKSTGAFGDTETLKNLRTAQEDFSRLAAGDFSGFEAQIRKSMSDALINTVGSGSPVGAFAGLAADQQMQYRLQGIQTSVGVSEFLSNESMKLLGTEFGVMDQEFNTGYQMDLDRINAVNQYNQQAAATTGVGTQAFGNAIQQIGSYGLTGISYNNNYELQMKSLENQRLKIENMAARQRSLSRPDTSSAYSNYSTLGGSYSFGEVPEPSIPEGGWDAAPGIPTKYSNPPDQFNSGGVLPSKGQLPSNGLGYPITYRTPSSILSSIGARIARA